MRPHTFAFRRNMRLSAISFICFTSILLLYVMMALGRPYSRFAAFVRPRHRSNAFSASSTSARFSPNDAERERMLRHQELMDASKLSLAPMMVSASGGFL